MRCIMVWLQYERLFCLIAVLVSIFLHEDQETGNTSHTYVSRPSRVFGDKATRVKTVITRFTSLCYVRT